jgi:AraC-like DNA-binding protein
MEDEHDRNMMNLFLKRDEYYDGILELSAKTYLRILEWMAIIGTEVYAQSDGYWTCRIRRYLLQILYLIEDIRMENRDPQNVQKEKSMVDILLEYIHINYSEDISLDLLCRLVHTNRTTLNRKFRERTGYSAMEYLLRHRLKLACESLVHTNLSLAELSEAIGFKYDTYFIRQFTAKMGMTPTEYRRKAWGE